MECCYAQSTLAQLAVSGAHSAPRRTRESRQRHIACFPTAAKSAAPARGSIASYHEHAAIDVQGVASDVGGLAARQVNDCCRNLVGTAEPAGGNRRGEPRP